MRLIDADAMRQNWLENGQNEYVYDTNAVLDSIDEQITIDPEDLRPKGRWEDMYGGLYDNALYVCSKCKELALEKSAKDLLGNWWSRQEPSRYCPNCGAKMEE